MSRLRTSDFTNVVELIQALFLTPAVDGVTKSTYGYSCEDITLSLRANFPANTMTDNEVCDLLARGAKSGVFLRSCASAALDGTIACGITQPLDYIFRVNPNMGRLNPSNVVYLKALGVNTFPTSNLNTGFLYESASYIPGLSVVT